MPVVGDSASETKTVTESDLIGLAEITLDRNPIHLDAAYAAASVFGQRIAPGMLSVGLVSGVLANRVPGDGSVLIRQDFEFTAPVYIGDTITATCTVTEVLSPRRCSVETLVTKQDGTTTMRGSSMLLLPETNS